MTLGDPSRTTRIGAALLFAALATACREDLAGDEGGYDASMLNFFPENLAEPIKVLRQSETEVVATITAGALQLREINVEGRPYDQLRLPGFSSNSAEGAPEIPSVQVTVAVPRGMTLTFDLLEQDVEAPVKLDHDLAFRHRLPFHNGKTIYAQRDAKAYELLHGAKPVVIDDESWAGTEKLATIRFFPVKYDPSARTLTRTSFLKVHFKFKAGLGLADDQPPVGGPQQNLFGFLALNAETAAKGSYAGTQKYDLIIAHESHKAALAKLIEFKKSRGRQVKDVYVTGKSAQEIKQLIAAEYKGATPPTHTMLVGNIDMIPAFRGSGDNTWTDYPYQTLDNGNKPDISLGRVPAHDAPELTAFIDKAIARETQPRKYDDVLLTSGEDTSLGCPTNVAAVGRRFAEGGNKTNPIQKFRTEVSTEDVLAGYNASPNLVVYDGHGYQEGMVEVPLLIRDLGKLTNTGFPIILDIACLNANWEGGARSRNFAESILLKAGAGAAGIMASGGSGYGHDYFQTIASIMAKARAAQASGDFKMNEIGQVILAAKAQHGDEDRSYWNYYGDPASSVWEPAQPTNPPTQTGTSTTTSTGTTTGTGTGTGTTTTPTQPSRDVELYAALSTSDNPAALFAAINKPATGVSYCVGDKAACGPSASWQGMTKLKDANGLEFYGGRAALGLTSGMLVTLYAKLADGRDFYRVVQIKSR